MLKYGILINFIFNFYLVYKQAKGILKMKRLAVLIIVFISLLVSCAAALSCDPEVLIADELTTALDTTIKAQILDIFRDLKQERNMSILFLTHDLGHRGRDCRPHYRDVWWPYC